MRICIRFAGDNDFITTMRVVMEVVRLRIKEESFSEDWGHGKPSELVLPLTVPAWMTDKDKLSLFVNQIIYGVYLGFQNNFEYGAVGDMKTYLCIGPDDILFDEEIDAFTNRNNDAAVYDTELEDSADYPIYSI